MLDPTNVEMLRKTYNSIPETIEHHHCKKPMQKISGVGTGRVLDSRQWKFEKDYWCPKCQIVVSVELTLDPNTGSVTYDSKD